jgi:hypothetical protein
MNEYQSGATGDSISFMSRKHIRKPEPPVPGTRKPLTRPIQPKDLGAIIAQQKQPQPNLTNEQMLEQLLALRDKLRTDFGRAAAFESIDTEIRRLEEEIETAKLLGRRGPH